MTGDDWARLIYLVLLGTAVAGYFLAANRGRMRQSLQQAAIWGFIFLGAIAGYGLWGDIRSTVVPRQSVFAEAGRVEVPRAADGHFYLTLQIEGAPVRFVVDTGASDMVLSRADAARAGLHPEDLVFSSVAQTANGPVATAPVRLAEVRLGEIADRNVRALVNSGDLDVSLLGMGYLNRYERLEMTRDRLVLLR